MKVCSKCKCLKEVSDFQICRKNHDALQCSCRTCRSAANAASPHKARERVKRWKMENPDKVRGYDILRAATHRVELAAYKKRHRQENPEKYKNYKYTRRSGYRGSFTKNDIETLWSLQKGKCAHPWCVAKITLKTRHLDHIIPVKLGGGNDRKNLQYLCRKCNLSKGAKHPMDFALFNGSLV